MNKTSTGLTLAGVSCLGIVGLGVLLSVPTFAQQGIGARGVSASARRHHRPCLPVESAPSEAQARTVGEVLMNNVGDAQGRLPQQSSFNETSRSYPGAVTTDLNVAVFDENPVRNYDVSPDGRRFLMIQETNLPAVAQTQMVLVENWFGELKRRVPVK